MTTIRNQNNVISAFTAEQVEYLTGLSKYQLQYWDRTQFYVPSYAEENRRMPFSRIYSFKDIVSLRTIAVLRKQYNVALQHLRKVVEKLSHLEDKLWTSIELFVLDRKVIFLEPGTKRYREIVSGQYLLGIPLKMIVEDTKHAISKMKDRLPNQVGKVERSRFVSKNKWVISGTRIHTKSIWNFHEAGYSVNQILLEYPILTKRDIQAALAHEKAERKAA